MKRIYVLAVSCILILVLVGCNASAEYYGSSSYGSSITILNDGEDDDNGNLKTVGEYLETKLKKQGLDVNYSENKENVNKNETIVFDLFENSKVPKESTTTELNGKSVARIMFEVSHPHTDENLALVNKLSNRMEKEYPAITRGVLTKEEGESNLVKLSIGGRENTLEEKKNTIDIMVNELETMTTN